ncbi:MAG: COP23 domain-containing protein [Desertifilum sp.]|nr:COP23 domain-containing protein [Desertifilum sp.]
MQKFLSFHQVTHWGKQAMRLSLFSLLASATWMPPSSATPSQGIKQLEPDLPELEPASTNPADTPRFTCQLVDGSYTVMYEPDSQPGAFYAWAKPTSLGGGWSEERRCNEISRRLEFYRPDGLLELQTGLENGYDIVCATSVRDSACRIVFTVPPGQDPQLTRDRVFENLTIADRGESTQAINTFVDGGRSFDILGQLNRELGIDLSNLGQNRRSRSSAINLRPFLDPADGGTGRRLR